LKTESNTAEISRNSEIVQKHKRGRKKEKWEVY